MNGAPRRNPRSVTKMAPTPDPSPARGGGATEGRGEVFPAHPEPVEGRAGASAGAWLEIAVEVAGIDAETVADAFRQCCSGGVAIEPAARLDGEAYVVDGDAPALVKGYLPPGEDSAGVRRSLRLALRFAPLVSPVRWRRARRLREQDWRDSWKRYFRPRRIGERLLVKPSWATYEVAAGDMVIEIDPGMAFGTGQHPTTAMCLRALEESVSGERPDAAVLDLGTGSGILAIAAARLGAKRVLALDTDPQAVKAARQNAAANGVAGVVEVREGTLPADAGEERFDLAVANISGLTIERLAPALAVSLRDGGTLIVSGFLEDTVDELSRALVAAGFRVERVDAEGVWRAIVGRAS
ncbi:MAG TPA: 50S ribosomal protein L11 methyltransferase [Dehalococcoidia bacterium]|nr:50S ribosomal protein L11 methyltransferase [Dehalococcoidia bacterium]